MAAKHTPGPWSVGQSQSHIYAPDDVIIAMVTGVYGSKYSGDTLIANRNLMAAAPELLGVLKRALHRLDAVALLHADDRELVDGIRAAIEKAEAA